MPLVAYPSSMRPLEFLCRALPRVSLPRALVDLPCLLLVYVLLRGISRRAHTPKRVLIPMFLFPVKKETQQEITKKMRRPFLSLFFCARAVGLLGWTAASVGGCRSQFFFSPWKETNVIKWQHLML